MLRLFTAIKLPAYMPERFTRLRQYDLQGARWQMRENFHLTLRFIGEVDECVADDIDAALGKVSAPGFTLTVKGAGSFSSGDKPRALWAGVVESEGLRLLQQRVDSALSRIVGPDDHGKYVPHITLAYLSETPDVDAARYLERCATLEEPPFGVRSFTLFKSHVGKKRTWYEPLCDYHFAETPEIL